MHDHTYKFNNCYVQLLDIVLFTNSTITVYDIFTIPLKISISRRRRNQKETHKTLHRVLSLCTSMHDVNKLHDRAAEFADQQVE